MGKHKSSVVWFFFNQVSKDPGSNSKAIVRRCKLCDYSIDVPDLSKANTSNLKKHLTSKHLEAFQKELNIRAEEEKVQKNKSERDMSQFLTGMILFAEMF